MYFIAKRISRGKPFTYLYNNFFFYHFFFFFLPRWCKQALVIAILGNVSAIKIAIKKN